MSKFMSLYSVYNKRTGEPLCIDATSYACQIYMLNARKKKIPPTDKDRLSKQFFQSANKSKHRNSRYWEFYKTDLDKAVQDDLEYAYSRERECNALYEAWLRNAIREEQKTCGQK